MRIINILFIFLLINILGKNVNGQTIKVQGYVKDADSGFVLPDVNVTLINRNSQYGIFFARTDQNGFFKIEGMLEEILPLKSLAVKASVIGYESLIAPLEKETESISLLLKKDYQYLQPVVVENGNEYIRRNKDTIIYNAEKFLSPEDRLLKDLLKNLPGVEVLSSGKINYNGKPVNKLYIEGKDLFRGNYQLATNNIAAKEIDKIQIIENNQDIKMLKGWVYSDQAGINIKLKTPKKLKVSSKAEVEGGISSKYNFDYSGLLFTPKFLGLNLLKGNNQGNSILSETVLNSSEDFQHFSEGNQPASLINLTSINPNVKENYYLSNRSLLLSLNNIYSLSKYKTVRQSIWAFNEAEQTREEKYSKYLLGDMDSISFFENTIHKSKQKGLVFQINFTNNEEKKYIDNSFSIETNRSEFTENILSNIGKINQNLFAPALLVKNHFKRIAKIGAGNNFEYSNYLSFYRHPQNFEVSFSDDNQHVKIDTSFEHFKQLSSIPTLYIDNKIKTYINFKKWNTTYEVGFLYLNQQLNTDLYSLSNNSLDESAAGFKNELNLDKIKVYSKNSISYNNSRSWFELDMNYSYTKINYFEKMSNETGGLNRLLPDIQILYRKKIGKENALNLNSYFSHQIGEINQILPNPIFLDYRNMSTGATPLYLGNILSLKGSFDFKKTLKMFFVNFSSNFSRMENKYIPSQQIDSVRVTNKAIPFKNEILSMNFNAYLSKYFFIFKTNAALNFTSGFSVAPIFQNSYLFKVNQRNTLLALNVSPKLNNWLKFELESKIDIRRMNAQVKGFIPSRSTLFSGKAAIYIYPNEKSIIFLSSEYFNYYLNDNKINGTNFLDAYYQLRWKKIDFRLSTKNLTNEQLFSSTYINNNLIQVINQNLLNRSISLSVFFIF